MWLAGPFIGLGQLVGEMMNAQAEAVVAPFVDWAERAGPEQLALVVDRAGAQVRVDPGAFGLQLFIFAGLAFVADGSLDGECCREPRHGQFSGHLRTFGHRELDGLAAVPVLVSGLLLLLSAALPSIVALLVPELDQCSWHDDRQAHLWFIDLPRGPLNVPASSCWSSRPPFFSREGTVRGSDDSFVSSAGACRHRAPDGQ